VHSAHGAGVCTSILVVGFGFAGKGGGCEEGVVAVFAYIYLVIAAS